MLTTAPGKTLRSQFKDFFKEVRTAEGLDRQVMRIRMHPDTFKAAFPPEKDVEWNPPEFAQDHVFMAKEGFVRSNTHCCVAKIFGVRVQYDLTMPCGTVDFYTYPKPKVKFQTFRKNLEGMNGTA